MSDKTEYIERQNVVTTDNLYLLTDMLTNAYRSVDYVVKDIFAAAGKSVLPDLTLHNSDTTGPDLRPRENRPIIDHTTGNAEKINIGGKEYAASRDANTGQIVELTIGIGTEAVTLKRTPAGFEITPTRAKLDVDGLKFRIENGRVLGDISMNKNGEILYNDGNGANRIETIKKADGTIIRVDFKHYERQEFAPPGTNSNPTIKFWDGYDWRNGVKKEDGNKTTIEFYPRPGEPGFDRGKPSVLERVSNPSTGTDLATVKFQDKDGDKIVDTRTFAANWSAKKQTETIPAVPPATLPTVRELFYDGATFREGKIDATNSTVEFKDNKDGEPTTAKYKADGSVETRYGKAPGERVVVHDKQGRVTEVQQQGGKKYRFVRDADGDITARIEFEGDNVKAHWRRVGPDKAPMMGAAASLDRLQVALDQPGKTGAPRKIGEPKGQFNLWQKVDPEVKVDVVKGENVFVTRDGCLVKEMSTGQLEINHLAKGTIETRSGSSYEKREFQGPDNAKLQSTDRGKKWNLPGQEGAGIEGNPVTTSDGHTLIRQTSVQVGEDGKKATVVKDFRVHERSINELDASGNEIKEIVRSSIVPKGGHPTVRPALSPKRQGASRR